MNKDNRKIRKKKGCIRNDAANHEHGRKQGEFYSDADIIALRSFKGIAFKGMDSNLLPISTVAKLFLTS